MDAMHWVLAAGAATAGAAAGWLLHGRARVLARAAGAEAQAAGMAARLDAEMAQAQAAQERLRGELADVRTAAQQEEREHEATIERLRDERTGDLEALATARQQLESLKREHAVELRAAAERVSSAERVAREQAERAEVQRKQWDEERRAEAMKREAALREAFQSLAGDALKNTGTLFLEKLQERLEQDRLKAEADLEQRRVKIDALVRPLGETLAKTDAHLAALKQEWAADRAKLEEQVRSVREAGEGLKSETLKLARALSRPEVRGRYGEMQLRRIAELAGMSAYCDFCEQVSQRDADGKLRRPDMVVRLPNDRMVAVDAKANIAAYLEAVDAPTPEERDACLDRFARAMAEQVSKLAAKSYWDGLSGSPDFVVMFVPGDHFLDAALARRHDLLDAAFEQNVILAGPATLIGLLRAVYVGWREKSVTERADELMSLGRELHERAANAYDKIRRVGSALESATNSFNDFVGSYQSRLEPTLKKFEEAGVKSAKELPAVETVTVRARLTGTAE